jgi:peptide/histidine transporter 3/4
MVTYLRFQLHQHPATAANNVTNWSGTCYITPLIGAFFADAYLGRFWTIVVFSIIYFLVITKNQWPLSFPVTIQFPLI